MMFFVLLAVTVSVRAEGYGVSSAAQAVPPAPAPYGAPYAPSSAAVQQQQQQQQPMQYQPYTSMLNQPIPIGGFPAAVGYGMYATQPQQLGQSPYQMYAQQQLPSSLYMNYPQGMVIRPQQQPQQQQQQQAGMAGIPSSAISYLTSSYLPSTSSTPPPLSGYAPHPSMAMPSMEREAVGTSPGSTVSAFTGFTPSTVDPWASLGSVTPKKTDNRKKKNSEGI